MDMKLAVDKTVVLSYGTNQNAWKVSDTDPDIEATLVARYLGVDITLQGRNLIKPRESRMISCARAFAHTIVGCTRKGLDRALTARQLWEICAVPGFLYATEAMVISKTTVKELEKIQHFVASFILQLPKSSSQVMGWMEAGLRPIQHRLDMRMILFAHSLIGKKKDLLTRTVAEAIMSDPTDPWTKRVNLILSRIGIQDISKVSRFQLKRIMDNSHIASIQQVKSIHSSLQWAAEPEKWFRLNPCINDSKERAIVNRVKAGDAGLGNRRPNHLGLTYKMCPWCVSVGIQVKLDEQHVILECPGAGYARRMTGVMSYLDARSRVMCNGMTLREFLGGDGANTNTMMTRGKWLLSILNEWSQMVSEV